MTVRRIKQLIGVFGAWVVLAVVLLATGIAASSVVAAGTGADPAQAFTDPTGRLTDAVTEWPAADRGLDEATRTRMELTWHAAAETMFEGSWTTAAAVGGTELEVIASSSNFEVVQLRARVAVARVIAEEVVTSTEVFDATVVQQPTGWVVVAMQRVAS